jgi:hypothetical protein
MDQVWRKHAKAVNPDVLMESRAQSTGVCISCRVREFPLRFVGLFSETRSQFVPRIAFIPARLTELCWLYVKFAVFRFRSG